MKKDRKQYIAKKPKEATNKTSSNKNNQIQETFTGPITISYGHTGVFIDINTKKKVIIYKEDLKQALHGDNVNVKIIKFKSLGVYQGKVTNIISRSKNGFIGVLKYDGKKYYIVPKDQRLYLSVIIESKVKKEDVDMVVYATDLIYKNNEITAQKYNVIGKQGEHETEIESIVMEQGFNVDFPADVIAEAKKINDPSGYDFEDRRDMRGILTFTIDPFDAKDFDDALSFRKISDDVFEVGIHIADVSHYIIPNSRLDQEAYKRATSIYLVDRTIPMLPEKLSNDVCSLKPNVDRLTMSVIVNIDTKGNILSRWFGKTIIHSDKRFTYEEAWEIINNPNLPFYEEISTLNNIAKKVRTGRERNGSLEFATEEIKCVLNPDKTVKEFIRKKRNDAHMLIEEYMLMANREVASLWNPKNIKKGHENFLFRTHDLPNAEKIQLIESIAEALGYTMPKTNKKVTQKDIQKFLEQIKGTAHESFLSTLTIRAMAKAIYSTKATGHFGLALVDYTHFTSPIRRYPDVVVHRFLTDYINNKNRIQKPKELDRIALHTSAMEKNAAEAERNSIAYKQIEYMLQNKDKDFKGKITGVMERGIFVSEEYSGSEGFVIVENLSGGPWEFNADHFTMTDKTHNRILRLGESINFKVVSGDPLTRKMDYKEI